MATDAAVLALRPRRASSQAAAEGGKRVTVRFPAALITAMEQLAGDHARSFSGEIVWAIREYVQKEAGHTG